MLYEIPCRNLGFTAQLIFSVLVSGLAVRNRDSKLVINSSLLSSIQCIRHVKAVIYALQSAWESNTILSCAFMAVYF